MNAALELARSALAEDRAWLVGGAVRDRALGREAPDDLDLVVDGDPSRAAKALAVVARSAGHRVACFELSREFGGWRVVCAGEGWQVDFEPLRGGSLEADLQLRDFTVNAIAEPIAGGERIDPLGGLRDLAVRRLRAAGPTAFADDPLRVLRLVRIALELRLEPEARTIALAQDAAASLEWVTGERIFAELARVVDSPDVVHGLELLAVLGATAVILPELDRLRGVQQSRFHHLDVYGHTIEVLERTIALEADVAGALGLESLAPDLDSPALSLDSPALDLEHQHAGVARTPGRERSPSGEARKLVAGLRSLLEQPLADGLTRGSALRWGALLHDIAKPQTRAVRPGDGRVTFIGHDERGMEVASAILRRLRASERLRAHVAALVRHHLRLGFLVHERQPLARRTVFSYLLATAPVEVDVTLLSVADRLATRGERSQEAIAAHLALARTMLADALSWRGKGAPQPLLRGDELARELGIEPGPRLGELVRELAAAQYAGEVGTREQALAHARAQLAG